MHSESFQSDHLVLCVGPDGNGVEIFVRKNTLNDPSNGCSFQTYYVGWNVFELEACYSILLVVLPYLIEPVWTIYPELD